MKKYLVKFMYKGRRMTDEFYGHSVSEAARNCRDRYPGCQAVIPKQVKS